MFSSHGESWAEYKLMEPIPLKVQHVAIELIIEFAKSQRAVENREKWRKLVAKSSVVPQQP